jgi:hypothetical protein
MGLDVLSQPEGGDKLAPPTNLELTAVPVPALTEEKKTDEQKMFEALKDFPFLKYGNGILNVDHKELKQYLKPITLKIGNLVKRGTTLANLNGGIANIDPQTIGLNSCIATALVGFEEAPKVNLLEVEDTDLIMGLYTAVVSYNVFFRKTPLGFIL